MSEVPLQKSVISLVSKLRTPTKTDTKRYKTDLNPQVQQTLNKTLTNYSMGPGSGAFESPGNSASNEQISKIFRRKLFSKNNFEVS